MKPKEGFTYVFLRFPEKGVTIDGAIDSASAKKVLEGYSGLRWTRNTWNMIGSGVGVSEMTEDEKAEYDKWDMLANIRTHIPDFDMATHIMRLVEYALKPPAPQWQPIDTAPKDGTRILCHNAKTGALFVRGGAMVGTPTHWMPLPPLPEKED